MEIDLEKFKKDTIDEHTNLGLEKSISYIPIKAIYNILEMDIEDYKNIIKKNGNIPLEIEDDKSYIESGAIYAYNKDALSFIIGEYKDSIIRSGSPLESEEFVKFIAAQWFDENHPIMPAVRAAFGDG